MNAAGDARPSMLILSFSPIAKDARLLKQISLCARDYRVVTCGYGPKPDGVDEHVTIASAEAKPVVLMRAALIRLHAFRAAYAITPAVREAKRRLRGRTFDAVFANDLDTAGLALSLAPAQRVHLDLHEYWPGREDQNPAWVRIRLPYLLWQLRAYATRARSVTTVSPTIARRYRDEFGIEAGVVTNASPRRDFAPTEVASPPRIVHSGASIASRRVEHIMRGVAAARNGATLDLYLIGEGTAYHAGLIALADELGDRVRVLPPVAQEDLLRTLNAYDVGIHVLPPTNTNNALALPNKFFDYIQARLALLIGPTASMAELLEEHELGVVSEGFEPEQITRAVEALDAAAVHGFKQRAHAAAEALSSERQNGPWAEAVAAIVREGRA